MKVNYALNHLWCETSLLSQAVLNYVMSRDQFCILTLNEEICMVLFCIRIFSVFSLQFALLQYVGQKCTGHMYITVTSGLISGSTSATHFQFWI